MENPEVFKGKKFQELLADIYEHSDEKRGEIKALIATLTSLINNANTAAVVVPLVAEIMDVAVKNDEHLIKLATIVQRIITTNVKATADSDILSEADKKQLIEEAHKDYSGMLEELSSIVEENEEEEKAIGTLDQKAKKVISKVSKAKEQDAKEDD